MEAQIELGVAAALHAPVSDMWQYLKQLREMNVDPALDWCDANRLKLDARVRCKDILSSAIIPG